MMNLVVTSKKDDEELQLETAELRAQLDLEDLIHEPFAIATGWVFTSMIVM